MKQDAEDRIKWVEIQIQICLGGFSGEEDISPILMKQSLVYFL